METIECKHREHVKSAGYGVEIGTCSACGQQVQYYLDKLKDMPAVIKLGRIDGRVVLPNHNYKLLLNPQDKADLMAAALQAAGPPAASPRKKDIKGPEKEDPKARRQRYLDNKSEMIRDLIALGNKAFLEKWKISSQQISHLKSDELYKKLAAELIPGAAPKSRAPRPKQPPGDQLPALPPWSDNWAPEVQVRWLAVYEKLISK